MAETRQCQNCKKDFVIEQEDFNFYEKIKVPPPTFCWGCRTVRRLSWRNEMSLFRKKCDAPGHSEIVISAYPPEEQVVAYDSKFWWGDGWDPLDYGKEYDFTRSFFEQWKGLKDVCPLQILSNTNAVNSDYCNVADDSRNSYMSSGSWHIEQTFYSNRISEMKDSSDLYIVHRSELCYDDVVCSDSYHLLYSFNCKNCVDSYFLYDCHGCINCFGCSNLRSKSYCIWNEQLSKEEYIKRLSEIDLTDYVIVKELKEKFKDLYNKSIHRFAVQIKTVNSTGDNLEGVKNCKYCFDASGNIEDSKYIHWGAKTVKDAYDSGPGVGLAELTYEVFDTGVGNYRSLFTSVVYSSNNAEYSFFCFNCSDIFGCVILRKKKYCILNQQYTKEEYDKLLPRIKEQMMKVPFVDKKGNIYKYGEFFPSEFSPFCYNETQAQDYFPLSKEEVIKQGYRWRERKLNEYKTTIDSNDLPNKLSEVNGSITKEVIGCENKDKQSSYCRGAYKITEDELLLYKKIGVPLPRLCFFCRHENRLKMRNPMKLWHRTCMNNGCKNEFETSFAPEKPEKVFCESCYNKQVY